MDNQKVMAMPLGRSTEDASLNINNKASDTIMVTPNTGNEEEDEITAVQKRVENSKSDFIFTGEALLNMRIEELPHLIKPLLPKIGVAAIAGSSDTGKSSFLRQLAEEIVLRKEQFIGFPIMAEHHSVIYVSTEDDAYSIAYLLRQQAGAAISPEQLGKLRFIFDTEDILIKLEEALKVQRADCVIIDTYTDLYAGDLNASNKVRTFVQGFSTLAVKYECLIIFLHHTGKRTQDFPPSKDNLLGSQGFEAKMRIVLELRKDFADPHLRHLCILKGNYIRDEEKGSSYLLRFGDNMLFERLTERIPFERLSKPDAKSIARMKVEERAIELLQEGRTIREVTGILNSQGVQISKTKVGELAHVVRPSVTPREEDTGQVPEE